MIVKKFGGTSVRDAEAIGRCVDIIGRDSGPQWVVVSALEGVTSLLATLATNSAAGLSHNAMLEEIRTRHTKVATELLRRPGAFILNELEPSLSRLSAILQAICTLREVSPRASDLVVGFGEYWATRLVHWKLNESGLTSGYVRAGTIIRTDGRFTSAKPILDVLRTAVLDKLSSFRDPDKILVTEGFIGSTVDDIPTTLGRGGSDLTATLLAQALSADEAQIWTDTNGVLTADPRVVTDAHTITDLSYEMADTLAKRGAKVLHSSTLEPVKENRIPVRVLNSFNPEHKGSLISEHGSDGNLAITGNRLTETSRSLLPASCNSVQPHTRCLDVRAADRTKEIAAISIIGETTLQPLLADICQTLTFNGIGIHQIALPSQREVFLSVNTTHFEDSVRLLHSRLCLSGDRVRQNVA